MDALDRATAPRVLLKAAATGVAYYALANPLAQLSGPGDTLAAIAWPAPACAIALLWPMRRSLWPPYLAAIFVAMMAVGRLDWLSTPVDFGFAALNVFEVALCAWLGQRHVDRAGQLTSMKTLLRFLLLLPVAAIGLMSALGATLASGAMGTGWWSECSTLAIGNGLAVLVLVPALLAWRRPRPRSTAEPADPATARAALAGALAVAAVMAAGAAWPVQEEIQRGLLTLVVAATAIYGGMKATSLGVGIAAALGVGLTLHGLGPYGNDGIDGVGGTWRLQVDMGGLAVLSFFVAVAARERRLLAVRLERGRRLESLGLLSSGIAHDFNNILGAVSGYAEITEEHLPSGSPALRPLREVIRASARGRDLTQQILLAASRGERLRETLDLHEIAREAVALAGPSMPTGVALTLEPPSGPLPVAVHRDQLVRAVLNLVRNASQAARGRVSVRARRSDAYDAPMAAGDAPPGPAAWIEVDDDGPGIAPDALPHLFEPFYSTRSNGTGLGLAIVAGVASGHDGGVSIDSGAGGTRFRLVLPLAPDAAPSATATAAAAARPVGRGETVMLVDDDRALRAQCAAWLAELGFTPLVCEHPRRAIEHAAAHPDGIALLVTDLDMPSMRGDALASRIRQQIPRLPVVLCSGSPELDAIARASRAVALPKPFDRDALGRAAACAVTSPT